LETVDKRLIPPWAKLVAVSAAAVLLKICFVVGLVGFEIAGIGALHRLITVLLIRYGKFTGGFAGSG